MLAGVASCTREFDQHSPSGTAWIRSGGARNLGEGQGARGERGGKVPPGSWMRMRMELHSPGRYSRCKDGICSGDRIELMGMDTVRYLRGELIYGKVLTDN